MPLSLTGPDATKATNLPLLMRELKALDEAAPADVADRNFYQIYVPVGWDFDQIDLLSRPDIAEEDAEAVKTLRREIREKIIELFRATAMVKDHDTQKPIFYRETYDVTPREYSRFFDEGDLAVMLDDIRLALQEDDPDFNAALRDRKAGVIAILERVYQFMHAHKDPRAAFKYFQRITRGGVAMPWEKDEDDTEGAEGPFRKEEFLKRLKVMEVKDLGLKNEYLLKELSEKLLARQPALYRMLVSAYEAAMLDFEDVDELERVEWLNDLLVNLRFHPEKKTEKNQSVPLKLTPQLVLALRELSRHIRKAEKKEDVKNAIAAFIPTISSTQP